MDGYFDHNATTPVRAVAREAWLAATDRHWQNPSSLYRDAGRAAMELAVAREAMAEALGAEPERVVFTGGATEANNAMFAHLAETLGREQRVLVSAVEHPSVREAARRWLGDGRVDELGVNADGVVELGEVEAWLAALGGRAGLVSLMAANNESGTIQPWEGVAERCRAAGVPFHSDATQWLGKRDSSGLHGCDWVAASAHKFGGPKGVGLLLLPENLSGMLKWIRGGPQESGHRAGTENYPAIAGMVAALADAEGERAIAMKWQADCRDTFEAAMSASFPGLRIIGMESERLWNTSLLVMPRHSNLKWLTRLSQRGFSISTGSACSSGREGSSVVVRALGATEEELRRVVRVSSGPCTPAEDWGALAAAFGAVGEDLDAGGATGGLRVTLG